MWNYGECSVACGDGTLVRTRKCNNPPPAHGKYCEGSSREVLSCYEGCCPGIKLYVAFYSLNGRKVNTLAHDNIEETK